MVHTRGKPYHPMMQGKIERWHRSLKNRICLENYYLSGDLEQKIEEFVTPYNTRRYHESLNNLTPEDVWLGRGQAILQQRRKIKQYFRQILGGLAVNDAIVAKRFVIRAGFFQTLPIG